MQLYFHIDFFPMQLPNFCSTFCVMPPAANNVPLPTKFIFIIFFLKRCSFGSRFGFECCFVIESFFSILLVNLSLTQSQLRFKILHNNCIFETTPLLYVVSKITTSFNLQIFLSKNFYFCHSRLIATQFDKKFFANTFFRRRPLKVLRDLMKV